MCDRNKHRSNYDPAFTLVLGDCFSVVQECVRGISLIWPHEFAQLALRQLYLAAFSGQLHWLPSGNS